MPTSEARISANRANALRSTGPRIAEGKERSRANSFKHGLTGDGVVVTGEDAAEIDRREEVLESEFRPGTEFARVLVRRVALLSVRLERSARQEAAAIGDRVLTAGSDFDEARKAEADRLVQNLGAHPATNRRLLLQSPEGVDALIREWERLGDSLEGRGPERWEAMSYLQADWLNGHNSVVTSDYQALTFAMKGRPEKLTPDEGAGLAPGAREVWARDQLIVKIAGEVAALKEHKSTLDTTTRDARRALAAEIALFDPSKEATLARKYEAAAERALFRTLKELRQVQAEAPPEESASFSPVDESDEPEPGPPTPETPPSPDFPRPVVSRAPENPARPRPDAGPA